MPLAVSIWTISSGLYALSAHLVVHGEAIGRNDDILNEVKRGLRRSFGIDHTTLQVDHAATRSATVELGEAVARSGPLHG